MKRFLALLLILCLVPLSFAAAEATASEYEVNSRDSGISKYHGAGGDVVIPGEIDGIVIRKLDGFVLQSNKTLTSLVFPDSIEYIKDSNLYMNDGLASVRLPEKLLVLDRYNFFSMKHLTEVTVPASVRYVGENCFYSCDALTSVTFTGPVPIFGADCFKYSKNAVVYVPDDELEAYRAALPLAADVQPSGQKAIHTELECNPDDYVVSGGVITKYNGTGIGI